MIRRSQHSSVGVSRGQFPAARGSSAGLVPLREQQLPGPAGREIPLAGRGDTQGMGTGTARLRGDHRVRNCVTNNCLLWFLGLAGLTPWEQPQQGTISAGHIHHEQSLSCSLSLRKRRNGDGKHLGHPSRSCKWQN